MKQKNRVSTAFMLSVLVVAALLSASCDSGGGMGVGVSAPVRWGSGSSGPPIFVGGPGGF
jgi:hypothetical protein